MLPLLIVVDLLQPSPPIESSLHLMLFPFVQIRHRYMDLTDHPGLGPLRMTVRVQGTTTAVIFSTVAVRMNATWNDSFLATLLATVEGPIHGDPLLPVIWNLLGSHLRNTRCDSLHGGHLRNTRGDTLQEGHPLQNEWASLLTQGLVHPGDPFLGILVLQGHAPPGFPSLQGEVPLLPRDVVMSRETHSPQQQHSSRASSREASQERPHSRSSPTHPSSPSREDREADDASMPAPVKAMIDFILRSFPEATASPTHPASRSFDLSASAGVTDAATPSGSLLAWCQAMSDSFTATQKRFSQRIKEGRVCHSLLPSLHRFERVSNSPTQGKELKANPDILDLLKNKVPDFRHLPISIKEGISVERSLRALMESHNFLTWSVMGLIKSLHEKKFLPKDDPVISQLQKSFSKACSNITHGLAANTAFITMKRRQLLLSHVVPSVSEAQKRNLLSDPFFQTGSLFDASSVESARSAARDLSLFKPHLQASSSKSQSRRQPYSSSSAQRGSDRQSSRPSSPQHSSSPFRQQSGRKGDSRFHKKSSGAPQKRGGFSEVGVLSLSGGRRLPSQLLVGLGSSGGGRLGGGGSAGWLSDPLRPSTSSI